MIIWDDCRTWNTSSFKLKTMTKNYSMNESDTLSSQFMNNPLVNNLSGRGTGQRARIWYKVTHYHHSS